MVLHQQIQSFVWKFTHWSSSNNVWIPVWGKHINVIIKEEVMFSLILFFMILLYKWSTVGWSEATISCTKGTEKSTDNLKWCGSVLAASFHKSGTTPAPAVVKSLVSAFWWCANLLWKRVTERHRRMDHDEVLYVFLYVICNGSSIYF